MRVATRSRICRAKWGVAAPEELPYVVDCDPVFGRRAVGSLRAAHDIEAAASLHRPGSRMFTISLSSSIRACVFTLITDS